MPSAFLAFRTPRDIMLSQGTNERIQPMNLASILFPKYPFLILCFAIVYLVPAVIQKTNQDTSREQTSFTCETEKFEHAIPLSKEAKEALIKEQSIADLMREQKLSPEQISEDWFTAAEVHLSGANENDLVIMGTRISRGAYTAGFWVLRKTGNQYRVVLRDDAHDLVLLESKKNGLCDISLVVVTLRFASTREFSFDGNTYKIAKRTLRPNMPDVQRDLSKYETHKPFIQALGQDEEPILAEARAWIWKRWQAHKRSYVEVSTQDADGEKRDCLYFIDDAIEKGVWQVTLKIHQTVWDQDSPSGPRYLVVENKLELAGQVERILPTEDDSQPLHRLWDNGELPASKYRLNFLDEDYSVFVF
jgi:hypothetical protein